MIETPKNEHCFEYHYKGKLYGAMGHGTNKEEAIKDLKERAKVIANAKYLGQLGCTIRVASGKPASIIVSIIKYFKKLLDFDR